MARGWSSGTSWCRERLAPFCVGYGCDLGFGGDAISDTAIRMDLPQPYAGWGNQKVQLGGDATNLYWFADGVLDYIYSSHLLEDFEDTRKVLVEWLRVLKVGGLLVLFLPDEQRYRRICDAGGDCYNTHHVHGHFSIDFVKGWLTDIGPYEVVHENPDVDDYCFELVVRKLA